MAEWAEFLDRVVATMISSDCRLDSAEIGWSGAVEPAAVLDSEASELLLLREEKETQSFWNIKIMEQLLFQANERLADQTICESPLSFSLFPHTRCGSCMRQIHASDFSLHMRASAHGVWPLCLTIHNTIRFRAQLFLLNNRCKLVTIEHGGLSRNNFATIWAYANDGGGPPYCNRNSSFK